MAALTWLRTFLTSCSTPTLSSTLASGVEATADTVLCIEGLRQTIESRTSAVLTGSATLSLQATQCDETGREWSEAGGDVLSSQLDGEAVREAATVGEIGAALGVPLGRATDAGLLTARMGSEVELLLSASARTLERRERLGEAQEALRRGAALAGRGAEGRRAAEESVAERRRLAETWAGRQKVMERKARDYETRAARERERVREGGVQEGCRHEKVAEMGRRLREREERLAQVERALQRFAGLPTVSFGRGVEAGGFCGAECGRVTDFW